MVSWKTFKLLIIRFTSVPVKKTAVISSRSAARSTWKDYSLHEEYVLFALQ
jgi:hypothetical protein